MAVFGKSYPYYLGYALGGGGARGFAHLGVLKVLEKHLLKPNIIVGTSAGALAGVFYADGYTPDEISEMFAKKEFRQFVEFSFPRSGLFHSTGLASFLRKNLRSQSFEELQIPFKAVATDWRKATVKVFDKGDNLVEAVVASCSVPVVFNPQYINDVPYVDGGLLKNFPVSIIRKECKYVVGVNVSLMIPSNHKPSIKNTAERTFNLMSNANTLLDRTLCDVLVEVKGLQKYNMFGLSNVDSIIENGYAWAEEAFADEKAMRMVKRCLHHYQLEDKVKKRIQQIK